MPGTSSARKYAWSWVWLVSSKRLMMPWNQRSWAPAAEAEAAAAGALMLKTADLPTMSSKATARSSVASSISKR